MNLIILINYKNNQKVKIKIKKNNLMNNKLHKLNKNNQLIIFNQLMTILDYQIDKNLFLKIKYLLTKIIIYKI